MLKSEPVHNQQMCSNLCGFIAKKCARIYSDALPRGVLNYMPIYYQQIIKLSGGAHEAHTIMPFTKGGSMRRYKETHEQISSR